MRSRFLVLVLLITAVFSLPARDRPVLKNNYKDYMRGVVCGSVEAIDDSQADQFRAEWESMVPLSVNLTAILTHQGQVVDVRWGRIAFNWFIYLSVFVGLYLVTHAIKNPTKSNPPDWLPSLSLLGGMLILCLFITVLTGLGGLSLSYDISNKTNHFVCSFLGYPEHFPSPDGNLSLSDVHNSAIAARDLARQLQRNLTSLQTWLNTTDITTDEWRKQLGHYDQAFEAIQKLPSLVSIMKTEAHWLACDLLYLREIIYWSQTIFTYVPSVVNDFYDLSYLGDGVGGVTWAMWMAVVGICCACMGWLLRQWWEGKASVLGLKRIAYLLGGLVVLLVMMTIFAEIWTTAGLAACHIMRQDIREIPYYKEQISHAEIVYKDQDNYNLDIGLKHFANAIHPIQHEGYMNQEPNMLQHYLSFQKAAIQIQRVDKSTLQSVFGERFTTLAVQVDLISETMGGVRHAASSKGVFGRVDLTPFGLGYSKLQASLCAYNIASWIESGRKYIWGAVQLLLALLVCAGLMIRVRLVPQEDEKPMRNVGVQLGPVSETQTVSDHDI